MPIFVTEYKYDANGRYTPSSERVEYAHRVLEVRRFNSVRNMSDTLDYSDYQTVACVEALVYVGRKTPKYSFAVEGENPLVDVPVEKRFAWVDCSNHFAWRGQDHRAPHVDTDAMSDPELAEDYAAWKAALEESARVAAEKRAADEAAEKAAATAREANRPVLGKKMEVFKGRKVPVGTVGTVAFISGSTGKVLLKADHEWKNRAANGVWVEPANLRARAAAGANLTGSGGVFSVRTV